MLGRFLGRQRKKGREADAKRPKLREETPRKGCGAKPEPYCAAQIWTCSENKSSVKRLLARVSGWPTPLIFLTIRFKGTLANLAEPMRNSPGRLCCTAKKASRRYVRAGDSVGLRRPFPEAKRSNDSRDYLVNFE